MKSKILIIPGVVIILAVFSTKITRFQVVKSVPQAIPSTYVETASQTVDRSTKSQDNPLQTVTVDYYASLPLFDDLVASFQGLKDWEIDHTLAEVENQLNSEDLVDRANKKKLDEAGYQRLAALIQKSDALYHIKIMRKVDDVEKFMAQTN